MNRIVHTAPEEGFMPQNTPDSCSPIRSTGAHDRNSHHSQNQRHGAFPERFVKENPYPTPCESTGSKSLDMPIDSKVPWRAILIVVVLLGGCGNDVVPPVKQALLVAEPVADPIENSIGMVLVPIPAGQFLMGSPSSERNRDENETQHEVTLTQPFYLGETEVTQGQWKAVVGTQPWKGKPWVKEGDAYPATYVSWKDAVAFCEKLSTKEGETYRLPTEAEWEYACRAGTTTAYSFGDDEALLGESAWFDENSRNLGQNYAHQVRQKKSNPWGLFDMHGNVGEWCGERYAKYQYSHGSVTAPLGSSPGSSRTYRGGSWLVYSFNCRSATRSRINADGRYDVLGFRVLHSAVK